MFYNPQRFSKGFNRKFFERLPPVWNFEARIFDRIKVHYSILNSSFPLSKWKHTIYIFMNLKYPSTYSNKRCLQLGALSKSHTTTMACGNAEFK